MVWLVRPGGARFLRPCREFRRLTSALPFPQLTVCSPAGAWAASESARAAQQEQACPEVRRQVTRRYRLVALPRGAFRGRAPEPLPQRWIGDQAYGTD